MPKATFDDFKNSFSAFESVLLGKSSIMEDLFNQLSKDVRIEMAADASDEGVPALSASLGLIEEYVDYELRLGSNFASDGKGAFSKLRMFGEKIVPLRRKIFTINGRDYDYDRVNFIMQTFIKMQGFILEPFGYFPKKSKRDFAGSTIFKTATCYGYIESRAAMPVPNVKPVLKTNRSEEELRKAYIEGGDFGAMFELFELYKETGEEEKSEELIDIYMDRGYYRWLTDAEEAMMAEEDSQDNN